MKSLCVYAQHPSGLTEEEIKAALEEAVSHENPRRVLLIPPDFTRFFSGAGPITAWLYEMLSPRAQVDILPALGTHMPVTREQWEKMFAPVPFERMLVHSFRKDVVCLGEIEGTWIEEISEGLIHDPVKVEINRRLLENYDLILSIGQVVPHEVVGMANRNKNLFVGCGGAEMINASHMLGAFYGMERIMGRDHTPVRKLFDEAEKRYLSSLPLSYILTVTDAPGGTIQTHGLFIGREREQFEKAVRLSQQKNLNLLERQIKKAVVYLPPEEFQSTWLGNKAVYRTRMALADGAELIVLAPGVERFGEDLEIDGLIRRYGYCGRQKLLQLVKENDDLKNNLSAAAHLIHGSGDGRFHITYCTSLMSSQEIEQACYGYMPYEQAETLYSPQRLKDGWNTLENGEEIYYISNPALGLWALKSQFE